MSFNNSHSTNSNALPLIKLTEAFAGLPGIGMKTAGRLAYHILTMNEEQVQNLTQSILNAHEKIIKCSICGNFTDEETCPICRDEQRERSIICVVEDSKDVSAFERTNEYNGLYHILGGLISPMDGVGPDQLNVKTLLARTIDEVKEVIMATNPTVEGEATAMYLSKLLKPMGVKVSRIAYGIPVGSDLEYADEVTLFKALQNRNTL